MVFQSKIILKYICLLFWNDDVSSLRDEVTSTCTYNPEAGPLLWYLRKSILGEVHLQKWDKKTKKQNIDQVFGGEHGGKSG